MTDPNTSPDTEGEQDLQDMIAEADTGGRTPTGLPAKVLFAVPLVWSLFQLWYASPLPFLLRFGVLNDTEARAIHLAFSIFLTFAAYPALKSSPRRHVPIQDWVFAVAGAFAAAYLYLFYEALSDRAGAPAPSGPGNGPSRPRPQTVAGAPDTAAWPAAAAPVIATTLTARYPGRTR